MLPSPMGMGAGLAETAGLEESAIEDSRQSQQVTLVTAPRLLGMNQLSSIAGDLSQA
jgi:hypothetical protein